MKNVILLISLSVAFNGYSQNRSNRAQREIETLEKLSKMMEQDRLSEFEAKKTVLNVYYDTKSEVRDKYEDLSELEKDAMNEAQETIWKMTIQDVIKIYRSEYKRFLSDQYSMLLKYNEAINELLYFAIDNDLEIEKNMKDFEMKRWKYCFNDWMEKPKF